jgi:uncharacterized protein YgiM (DUF1202 family)
MYNKMVSHLFVYGIALCLPAFAIETSAPAAESAQPSVTQEASKQTKNDISFKSFTGRVRGNKVRMRAHPSLDSSVVRETSTGDLFAVVGEEKDFYKVQPSRGTKGYVFRTFILDNIVEGDRVNVRLSPDVDSPSIGQLHAGEKVNAVICEAHNKWLEIALPATTHFYIAKEYLENVGGVEIVLETEARREQAFHLLNAAFHFATGEIQKPFDEVSLEMIHQKFNHLISEYSDIPEIVAKAKETDTTIEETYVQKKIAFLEAKADRTMAAKEIDPALVQRLTQIGRDIKGHAPNSSDHMASVGKAASDIMGHMVMKNDAITDKMLVWQSLEESLYHLWAATHDGKSMSDFYEEEISNATILTGIVEPFNRPVKNRPGDYVLRTDNMPVAFLYSTKINLQDLVGKRVKLVTTPRPNNNFAFPAYFVISAE